MATWLVVTLDEKGLPASIVGSEKASSTSDRLLIFPIGEGDFAIHRIRTIHSHGFFGLGADNEEIESYCY